MKLALRKLYSENTQLHLYEMWDHVSDMEVFTLKEM